MSDDPMYERLKAVLYANRDALLARPYVNAVAIGYKTVGGQRTEQLAILVSVSEKKPESELKEGEILPKLIQGCPTDVNEMEVVDPFKGSHYNAND